MIPVSLLPAGIGVLKYVPLDMLHESLFTGNHSPVFMSLAKLVLQVVMSVCRKFQLHTDKVYRQNISLSSFLFSFKEFDMKNFDL